MRKLFRRAAPFLLVLGLAACGAKAHTTNGQTKAQEQQAVSVVQPCLSKGDPLSKAGRQAILNCIAPPGHLPQFEACAIKVHPVSLSKWEAGVGQCAEENR